MDTLNEPTLKNAIKEIAEFHMNRGQISYDPSFEDIIKSKFVES